MNIYVHKVIKQVSINEGTKKQLAPPVLTPNGVNNLNVKAITVSMTTHTQLHSKYYFQYMLRSLGQMGLASENGHCTWGAQDVPSECVKRRGRPEQLLLTRAEHVKGQGLRPMGS